EVWLVRNLFFLQLFQSIGIAMLLTLSNALFLAQFNVDELPKVYILSGVILLLVNYIYAKLEHHLQIQRLILYILATAVISILAIRLLIYSVHYDYAPVLLLIWYQVIYLVCGNSFWGLASQVFDVRESKRTFSILSAGDTPAKLLGYLSISAFAGTIGINNFLFISVLCFVISFLFMQSIIRSKKVDFHQLAHHAEHKETLHAIETPSLIEIIKSFFGNNLILLISVLAFIVIVSLTVIDFTFLSEVKLKYDNDVTLAAFLGSFFAVGRLFAILAKITLTSRIEQRLGIKRSLLILPVLLVAFTLFILVSERVEGDLTFYLYVFGGMVVMTEVLKSVLQDPLILVLFQPLKPLLRLKGHLISKGILAPLGLLFAGVFIYINIEQSGRMYIGTTCVLLMIMCAAWILVVYLLDRQYIATLLESLKKGFFRGNLLLTNDQAVKQLLADKLVSSKPLEVIYAADTLEKLDTPAFNESLPSLLNHQEDAVKKFALKKARDNQVHAVIPKVEAMLNDAIAEDLRIDCLLTLTALHKDRTEVLLTYLDHPNRHMQQQAMVALFTSGDINAIIIAGKKMIDWMNASNEELRFFAAETIGEVADKNFYTSLAQLIKDPSPSVQKRALEAAGQIKSSRLIPLINEKLNQPSTASAAINALVGYGEEVITHFPPIPELLLAERKIIQRYIKIAERVSGEKAKTYLEEILLTDAKLKTTVISALKEMGYSAPEKLKEPMEQLLFSEIDIAEGIISYLGILTQDKRSAMLCNALRTELNSCETNIFYLLSFTYHRQKFLQAFENIRSARKENLANAIEIIDLGVPKKVSARLIPFIEFLHLEHQVQNAAHPGTVEVLAQIKKIIANTPVLLTSWTTAAAIYTMNQISAAESIAYLSTFETHGDYLVEETRNFVLAKQP
ncbi:MAG TPA: HEAT repeat domain-containing protein, partial [Chitinophagales bacterium]|nr:HEAT repeat domain-containing protein [Chitinophagales bacterium]